MYEMCVGDWTNCNILTPSSFVFSSTSFSFCWAAQSEVLRAHSPLLGAGSLSSNLSPTNWLQLSELPVAPGYIIVWHPPASCERRICTQFNPSMVKVIPWYLRQDAPVPRLTAGSKVNMLHYKEMMLSQIKVLHLMQSRFSIRNSIIWRCRWCNGYRRRKWTRRHEFKSWTRLIAFHIALIPLGKVWIQLFSLQLWVNSRAD